MAYVKEKDLPVKRGIFQTFVKKLIFAKKQLEIRGVSCLKYS
jgi:hypothetical protein